jgi:hypothetical protein
MGLPQPRARLSARPRLGPGWGHTVDATALAWGARTGSPGLPPAGAASISRKRERSLEIASIRALALAAGVGRL